MASEGSAVQGTLDDLGTPLIGVPFVLVDRTVPDVDSDVVLGYPTIAEFVAASHKWAAASSE
jgi:hypothetical protein